ncbi:hypothetical protein NGRA_3083 [Nosema granulosis]|uniref:Uncharacterized protein n=1 Tax=Nosema granulosis TaxID=83296 RepID=A0A9P6GVF6_9MICR|nr:hypothetical protein NGRA_3083 [Nosema granulosis]
MEIKAILNLGGSFVLYKPNLRVFLEKLDHIYRSLVNKLIISERRYLDEQYSKYYYLITDFYESKESTSRKAMYKLESFINCCYEKGVRFEKDCLLNCFLASALFDDSIYIYFCDYVLM